MLSRMTFSIRHFSVPIVLLIVLLAPLPRMIASLGKDARSLARGAMALTALFALSSLVSVIRAYPNYFPYLNALTWSHPIYWWASDSNVDWNQALPEVETFARQHGLKTVGLDAYSTADPLVVVPQARFWDCQDPSSADAGQWVVVSSNMILDQHNCSWLMQYPHRMLAAGSMWAIHLPSSIPPAGTAGGPPPASARKIFLGMPEDFRLITLNLSRHPGLLPQYCAEVRAEMWKRIQEEMKKHSR